MEIVVGTWNAGKLEEMQQALAKSNPEVQLVGINRYLTAKTAPPEVGQSYYENALEKARFYAQLLQKPVLADDGGLELAAFPEILGLHTSRFFKSTTDEGKNQEILELYNTPELQELSKRQLTLHACLVYVTATGQIFSAAEMLSGYLVAPRGMGGYGFDSIFYLPKLGKTLAQLSDQERDALSPRIRALQKIISQIKEHADD
ncbi:non-canonical purine NTP pyrophosphatase [Enterococcus asini]|uniref:non-canonical purine NTP pyrophosphatase n=1 Tax=Enterococcus asini TaxID=57732 RepID=UPI00266B6CDE|nr:non-canonical purine NTP pyrophosphatase [Enterococcus asini]